MTPRGAKREAWRLVVTSYACHICGAPPGRHCVSETGHPKGEPHADRARLAAARGWAFADAPARCYRCHRPLPGENPDPGRCARCRRQEDGPNWRVHATRDHPGPDGSYDVPIFGEDP
jgi:hypothetical protein